MMKQAIVWKLILESLNRQVPVMLLYVLESKGSSPGRQGFSMAVTAEGEMQGSIGGGIMEHKFVEFAIDKLRSCERIALVRKQYHDKEAAANQSGMICSGEQTIFLYTLSGDEKPLVNRIYQSFLSRSPSTLFLSPKGLGLEEESLEQDHEYFYRSDQDWQYKEFLGILDHLHIIGGGHCALALSRLMSTLNFCVHLYDDREDLNTFQLNEFAQEKKLLNSYSDLSALIPEGQHQYVIAMTFGYRTDDLVVRALIDKKFNYFGLLGSSTKIGKMFSQYREEQFPEEQLARINAPAGIPIKSQTPEEIAVSIAAEIIRVRNADR